MTRPHLSIHGRLCGALALALSLSACARTSSKPASAPATAEAEPVFDTIQEFRRGERVACAEGTELVYVLSRDGALHSFDPVALRFRRIGPLDCPGTARALPHSMAVDRAGRAWVGYDNGVIALASIVDASCSPSSVRVPVSRVGRRFGMGFAPTPEGGIAGETLFLTTEPTFAGFTEDGRVVRGDSLLARIDDGVHVTVVGRFPPQLRGLSGELASRPDGRLFAFFTGDPFQLVEIGPSTVDVRSQKRLDGMRFAERGIGSWAFAAVGEEFFFFWADAQAPSVVTRLHADGRLEHVIRDAGMQIVGAGASTCASRTPSSGAAPREEDAPGEVAAPDPPAPVPAPPPPPSVTVPFSKLPRLPPPKPKVTPPRPGPKASPPRPRLPRPRQPSAPRPPARGGATT